MFLEAERIFNEYMGNLENGGEDRRFIIGVSGGADSICLLFLMKDHLPKDHLRVIHVNHMIRGDEADGDALFVRDICKEEGLFFREVKRDIPAYAKENGLSEEEAARKIRYEIFRDEALLWEKEEGLLQGSVLTAVAHHLEDTAETFLFNLFRGSGIAGLSGIAGEKGNIVRPLLKLTREDIEEYLAHKSRTFRTDSTNHDLDISRNRIRNVIIPEADKICPRSALHISRASEKLRKIADFLDKLVEDAGKKCVVRKNSEVRIDKNALNSEDEIISSMLVLKVLTDMTPMKKDIGEIHVNAVLDLAGGPSGRHADLPYGIIADSSGSEIILQVRGAFSDDKDPEDGMPSYAALTVSASELTDEEKKEIFNPSSDYTKYFDCDKITGIARRQNINTSPVFEIRHRKNGDYLTINKKNGETGKKSLSDYLTDLKLSVPEKEKIWVVSIGSEVLWVIGYRMSDLAKIGNETVNILKLSVEVQSG